jgi:hypothetical protein
VVGGRTIGVVRSVQGDRGCGGVGAVQHLGGAAWPGQVAILARRDAGFESCQAHRQAAAPVNTEVCLIFLACVLSLWSAAPRHT